MHGHIARQPFDELQSSLLLRLGLGAIGSMHQLGDGHDRHADFGFTLNRLHLFEDFPDSMVSAAKSLAASASEIGPNRSRRPPDFPRALASWRNARTYPGLLIVPPNANTRSRRSSLIRSGVRGKYAKRYHEGANLVLLAPDVAAAFPDAKAVNAALRLLMTVAKQAASNGKVPS